MNHISASHDCRCDQQAILEELQTAMRLSRQWLQQGKPGEAHQLLASVNGWCTEGFDTADLQEAKALGLYLRRRGYESQPKERFHLCWRGLSRLVRSARREAKP
jgi:hypothetical protein